MSQEFDVNLDLTEIFSFKKSPIAVQTLARLNTFGNINTTEILKHFQYQSDLKKLKF